MERVHAGHNHVRIFSLFLFPLRLICRNGSVMRRDAGVGVGRQFHIFFIIVIGCGCKKVLGCSAFISAAKNVRLDIVIWGKTLFFAGNKNRPCVRTVPLVSVRNERFLVISVISFMSEVLFGLL